MKIAEQSVELIDHMGSDLSVVNAARVSFHKESDWEIATVYSPNNDGAFENIFILNEKDQKLIGYLAKHNHWTPFAHCYLSFRIKAPIFVARQLVKHQVGLAWNEVSRRYVDEEPEFWFPKVWRARAENVKQGSSDVPVDVTEYGMDFFEDIPKDAVEVCFEAYKRLLAKGVAPEQARMVLPLNTMTEWTWSGSLAAFARVCKLRLDARAQAETREIAEQISAQVPKEFEHSWQALLT